MAAGSIEELIKNYQPEDQTEEPVVLEPQEQQGFPEPQEPQEEYVPTYQTQSLGAYLGQTQAENNPDYVPPLEDFNPYTTEAPQTVTEPQEQFADVFVATQDYADEWTQKIIDDRNGYMTDDNYEGALNRTLTEQAYNYLKRANNGADETAWSRPNPQDDLFTKYLPDIIKTQEINRQASEQMKQPTPTAEDQVIQNVYDKSNEAQQAIMDAGNMEHGSWYLMSPLEKAKYLIVPGSNQTTMDNAPWWTKFITNIAPAVMAGSAGAMLGSLVPVPGVGTAVGLAVGGLTYLQGVTGIQIPIISDVLSAIDLGEKVEPYFTGGLSAISKAYGSKYGDKPLLDTIKEGDLDIINLAVTAAEIMKDPKNQYLWEVSKYGYEVGADAMDDILLGLRNAIAGVSDKVFDTEFGQRESGTVSRANIGRSGIESLVEGTYGADSLIDTYLPLFTSFVDEGMKQGMTEKQAIDFAHQNFTQYILNYTGTTGLVTDLASQSVVDPANLAPFVTAKITEGTGHVFHDQALIDAGRAAAGNPIIDMLPPIIQQGAELITGKHGSQGLDTIKQVAKEKYRGTFDVDSLSGFQRHIAGLDKEGKFKELNPFKSSGNVVADWAKKFFGYTEDTKMFDVTQVSSDFLGSVLFNDDTKVQYIPEMIREIAGKADVPPDSPLAKFQKTAVFRTLQDAYSSIDDATINKITKDVQNYRKYGSNRAAVEFVAQELGMDVNDVFNALDNKGINDKDPKFRDMDRRQRRIALDAERQDLFKRIRDAGLTLKDENGNVIADTNKLISQINVFKQPRDGSGKTVGRRQFSEVYMKASIMDDIANVVDDFNLKRYGIKPDSWAVRTSNLMKSMQSIALLNFSTSYQVNNFLNNALTRSVVGVGGGATGKISDLNTKRGLFFARGDEDALGNKTFWSKTGEKMREAKKGHDALQRITDMYNKATDNVVFKGVNNLNIEGTETAAAFNIGANRYWDATWGGNIPEIPKAWEALGITPDMKDQIFKLALDSPNLETFRKKLMGEVILPGASSTLDQMIANNYDANSAKVIHDFFSTKPWVKEMVDSFLETGDERLINKGFDELISRITSDVGLQNVVQLNSTFEDLRNTYADQGLGAAATAFEALNDLYAQIWINQTKENGTLFLDRVTGAISWDDFDRQYSLKTKVQTNDYNMVRGYTIMNLAALAAGIGMDSDTTLSMMANAMRVYDLGEEYIKVQHEMHQKYAKKNSPDYDIKKWQHDDAEACKRFLDAQQQATLELHKTFIDYLRTNLDDTWKGHIDRFEQLLQEVTDLKKAENATEVRDATKRVNTDYASGRAKVSIGQERPRRQRKQQIHDTYEQAAKYLKQMEGGMQGKPKPGTKAFSLEDTLKFELLAEEARHMSEFSGEFLKKYQDGSDPAKVYEPMNFENTNVKTTFVEYGRERIAQIAKETGIDPTMQSVQNFRSYLSGDAVTLGTVDATRQAKFYEPNTGTYVDHPVLDHFQLVNPDTDPKVTGSKFSMAKSEPYLYGGNIVNAGVFYQGKVIAYITEGMQQSVTVDGKTYPVIGISPNDPNTMVLYVGNKVREVTPGKPKGIEYTGYAKDNFHPGGIGTTPTIDPSGLAALETSVGVRDAVNRWRKQAVSDLHKAQENGSLFGKLTPDQRQAVFDYLDGDLRQAYNAQRYMTQRYGETMVDAALLNYNRRYGFDNMLTMLSPYQFWMTRSVANWGKRMVSQPKWFSMYARMQKLIEKNKKDFLPTRLEGLIGIPMPNMGDGMGDSFYFDIANVIFPFQQFYNITDYFEKNLNTIHQNTLTQIQEMYDEGKLFNGQPITDEMLDEAMQSTGDLYWTLFEENRKHDESDTSAGGLLGTFFGPPVWVDALRKHIAGKDKNISYSPMYRTGNMVKAAGDDTWMEDITNFIGGAMQMPENALRGAFGIESNPDGNFKDYGVISIIANMQTENEISENDALNAIAEGEGNPIYDKALKQYRQEQAMRMQGGALATEIGQSIGGNKETSLGQIAGSALVSLFGGKTFSEGERMHREHQQQYREVIKNLDKDSDAYRNFWNEHPDYSTHSYAYEDDPEARYHKILVDNLSNAYYALPYEQQNMAQRALGPRFNTLFVNKETKATDYIDNDELIQWTRALQGNTPNLDEQSIAKQMQDAIQMKWYSDSVLADYERYQRDKERKFPGIDVVEQGYYNCDPKLQTKYLLENPMLKDYWEWNDKVKRANPALGTYMLDKSVNYKIYKGQYDDITSAVMASVSDWTLKQLKNHMEYGWAINPKAEITLRRAYTSLQTNVPYEQWRQSLISGIK